MYNDLIMLFLAFLFISPLFIIVGIIYFLVYRKTSNYKNRKRFTDSHFIKHELKEWGSVIGFLILLCVIFIGGTFTPLPQILGEGLFWFLWAILFVGIIVAVCLIIMKRDTVKEQKCTLKIEAELIDILCQHHNIENDNSPTPTRFTYFCKFRYRYKGKEYIKIEEFFDIWTESNLGKGYIYINPNNPKQIKVDRKIFLGSKYKNEEHDLYNNI